MCVWHAEDYDSILIGKKLVQILLLQVCVVDMDSYSV